MGQAALAIIGEDHDIAVGNATLEIGELGIEDFVRGRRLEVDPQQLLLATDDAQLHDGIDLGVNMQAGIDLPLFEQLAQRTAGLVITDNRQQGGHSAQRGGIAGNVGGATEALFHTLDLDHRHRGFRRNSTDITKPVAVEHDIADDQQTNL